jgi:4-carboxymuconolactone decarboxylase
MSEYYQTEDLDRFGELGGHNPFLFKKFVDGDTASLEPGVVSQREKVLIGVAVAHAIPSPYCIEAYTKSCLGAGLSLEQIAEAVHGASTIRGGARPIHTLQAHNAVDRSSL